MRLPCPPSSHPGMAFHSRRCWPREAFASAARAYPAEDSHEVVQIAVQSSMGDHVGIPSEQLPHTHPGALGYVPRNMAHFGYAKVEPRVENACRCVVACCTLRRKVTRRAACKT